MIKVAGVAVPRAAIAKLAEQLQRNGDRVLAHRLGHAIDKNLDRLEFTALEAELILAALRASPIDELEPLSSFLSGRSRVSRRRLPDHLSSRGKT